MRCLKSLLIWMSIYKYYIYIYIYQSAGDTEERNGVTVSYEFTDLWTDVREWSVRPVWRLRTASKQIWLISHKKPISQLQPPLYWGRRALRNDFVISRCLISRQPIVLSKVITVWTLLQMCSLHALPPTQVINGRLSPKSHGTYLGEKQHSISVTFVKRGCLMKFINQINYSVPPLNQ